MALDAADRAWIRYVASRDQLLAARDTTGTTLPAPRCPDDLGEIDARALFERLRITRRRPALD